MEVELAAVNAAAAVPRGAAVVADVAVVAAAVVDVAVIAADAAVLSEVEEHPTVVVGLSAGQLAAVAFGW